MNIAGIDLSLGVEEEYQIINPKTRDLDSYVRQCLDEGGQFTPENSLRPELMQSQIEAGSSVCSNVREIRSEIIRMRGVVQKLAGEYGMTIASAGTHPFADWSKQTFTAGERYARFLHDMAGVANQMLTFGLHVHIGFGQDRKNRDLMIEIGSQLRYFLPHILAISTSSPFWKGRNTGLKSYRSVIMEMMPRTGIPSSFHSFSEYQAFVDLLGQVGSLAETNGHPDATMIWWDLRFNPKFDTLEIRISDACTLVDEAVCVVAMVQVIVVRLLKLYRRNQSWRSYRRHHIVENKWRAMRYGIEDKLIDFGKKTLVSAQELMTSGMEKDLENAAELGSLKDVGYIETILKNGTSADRQLAEYKRAKNDGADDKEAFQAVVDHLCRETVLGV
jgi:glutamate---cysteine ligase / carboxylate-amine ligase